MELNLYTLSVIYLVYSFLGWVGETVVATAKGRRFTNRGVASGPFCFVYGTAGVLLAVGLAADAAEAVTLHYALEAFSFRDPGHVHPVLFREEFYGQRVAEIHFRHVLEFRKFAFRSRAGFLEVT